MWLDLGGQGRSRGFWGTPESCRVTQSRGPGDQAPLCTHVCTSRSHKALPRCRGALSTRWRRGLFPPPHLQDEETGVEVSKVPEATQREGPGVHQGPGPLTQPPLPLRDLPSDRAAQAR